MVHVRFRIRFPLGLSLQQQPARPPPVGTWGAARVTAGPAAQEGVGSVGCVGAFPIHSYQFFFSMTKYIDTYTAYTTYTNGKMKDIHNDDVFSHVSALPWLLRNCKDVSGLNEL